MSVLLAVSVIVAVAAGFVLSFAALRKSLDIDGFAATLAGLGIRGGAVAPLAVGFVLAEGLAGVSQVVAQTPLFSSALGLVVCGVLVAVAVYGWVRDLDVGCGCFGSEHRRLGRATLPLAIALLVAQIPLAALAKADHVGGVPAGDLPWLWACAMGGVVLVMGVGSVRSLRDLRTQRRAIARYWEAYARLD